MEGILFGKYEVLRPIGNGGFSDVYLVRDMHLNKLRAVKKYTSAIGTDTEVNTLKDLQHKGLPIIYDYRENSDDKYLFMEYVEGMTLREYLKMHKIVPLGIAIKWISEIAQILEYLHGLKPSVIYRDLKPENIMIKNDGHIKLIDFGGVLLRSHTADECKAICGTKGYSAPELFKGRRAEFSADIYSLGIVFGEMITGYNMLNPSSDVLNSERIAPKGIEIVIRNCIRNKPSERYQTIGEFMKDLGNYKKLVIGKDICFFIKKAVVLSAYLLCALSIVIPLYNGVNKEDIPFPFLYIPLICAMGAVVVHVILLKSKDDGKIKIVKSILLTQKKSNGLLLALFFTLGLLGGLSLGILGKTTAYADENISYDDWKQTEESKELWVDLCDTNERKMLLKNDAVYKVEDKVRLEIPGDSIPNEDVSIRIIATGKNGHKYVSRTFNVSGAID